MRSQNELHESQKEKRKYIWKSDEEAKFRIWSTCLSFHWAASGLSTARSTIGLQFPLKQKNK